MEAAGTANLAAMVSPRKLAPKLRLIGLSHRREVGLREAEDSFIYLQWLVGLRCVTFSADHRKFLLFPAGPLIGWVGLFSCDDGSDRNTIQAPHNGNGSKLLYGPAADSDAAALGRFRSPDRQYDLLTANTGELWLRAILAAAYTFGFRRGELLSLKVRHVDLPARTIHLEVGSTKNREGRTVKMTHEVWELLAECVRDKKPDDHVFTRSANARILDFRSTWTSLTTAAGLSGLLFHDLRRSAVRNMVRRGVPETVAMKISGHKTRSVFDRYDVTSGADLEQAAARIEAGRAKPTATRTATGAISTSQPVAPVVQ